MALFTTILGSTLLAAIANALVAAAVSFALSTAVRALQKKPKSQTNALDFEQTVLRRLRNGQPLEVLVGRRIVAGVGHYDNSYSVKNERAVSVTVMSAKPCSAFHTLFLDGEPVTLSGDPTTAERTVTSHFLGKNNVSRVRVRVFLGDDNSGLGEYLGTKFPSKFSVSDDFGDYCVMVVECHNTNDDFDEENNKNFIPFQGFPEYKAEMSGVKICDPRVSGSDYGDETTYVYSDNAALIDAQFDYGWYSGVGSGRSLIVGNGYPDELMDVSQIIDNANYCDAEGFMCAGVLRSGNSGDQEEVWKCYNADRYEGAAKVFSIPEGNRPFSEHIDLLDHPASFISAYDEDGYSTEVYNEVRTVYAEPQEFYGEKDLPVYSDPSWVAADNHIPRQMSLPLLFVTDKVQAGKLEKQEINISRSPSTCTVSDLPYGFIRTRVGDRITLGNADVDAVNGRMWIVKGRSQTPRGDVSLVLREYAGDSAFAFDEATETPSPLISVPVARPWSEWYDPRDWVSPQYAENFTSLVNGEYPVTDILILGRGHLNINTDTQNTNINTALLDNSSGSLSVTGSATFAFGNGGGIGGNQLVTTNGVTVDVSGGTAPYTWNVTYVSGDTSIVAKTPSGSGVSHSTVFERNCDTDEFFEGVYKFTVTDDVSDSIEFSVNITITNADYGLL